MPLYTFFNTETEEYKDVFFKMNDKKEYFGENGEEFSWVRVYHSPNMSIDTKVNPFSSKDFLNKTKNCKTYGEAISLSQEMSDLRSEKLGTEDPQRKKAENKFYRKNTKQKKQ